LNQDGDVDTTEFGVDEFMRMRPRFVEKLRRGRGCCFLH